MRCGIIGIMKNISHLLIRSIAGAITSEVIAVIKSTETPITGTYIVGSVIFASITTAVEDRRASVTGEPTVTAVTTIRTKTTETGERNAQKRTKSYESRLSLDQ